MDRHPTGRFIQLAQGRLQHFAKQHGMLDDNVTSLAADNHGQVWIGSKSGLNLWTGHQFKSFTQRDGLPDNFVSGVNVARSGTVWITARNGMCQIVDGHITPYAFQTESQGRSPEYLGTYEDRRGNLWAFGDTYLINLTEANASITSQFRIGVRAHLEFVRRSRRPDLDRTSGRGLFCFEDNRFQPVIFGENRWPYDVRAICEDREGKSVARHFRRRVGAIASAIRACAAGGRGVVQQLNHGPRAGYERKTLCRSAAWRSVRGRIRPVRPGGRHGRTGCAKFCFFVVHLTRRGGLGGHIGRVDCMVCAMAVAFISPRRTEWPMTTRWRFVPMWMAAFGRARRAGTVHRFNGKNLVRFDTAQGLPGTPVTVMIPAAVGGLWLGTQDGQILREEKNQFISSASLTNLGSHPVLALHEGEAGRLWIGTAGGGLACLINEDHGSLERQQTACRVKSWPGWWKIRRKIYGWPPARASIASTALTSAKHSITSGSHSCAN